jgi:predicted metallo-beta-lactamase superfamily hydrolase
MGLVPVGNGEIRVLPLAFESFGVRSMATLVETDDVRLVIDPGSALGPRFKLSPHESEYMALAQSRQVILDAARDADVLTISHYHFDHYVPSFEDWFWTWSSPELAERLYRGKLILVKDISSNINLSQQKRGYVFQKLNSRVAKEIRVADGKSFKFGHTTLKFSRPVFHGPPESQLGYVLMLTIQTPGCSVVHASDVQGPIDNTTLALIMKQRPDALLVGGPPIYLKGFKIDEEILVKACNNMIKIAGKVPLSIVDHHLLRSLEYREYLKPVHAEAERSGHRVLSASELIGQAPQLLEARRNELHKQKPVEREWYAHLERGEFRAGFKK